MTDAGIDYIKRHAKKRDASGEEPIRMVHAIAALEIPGMTYRRARRIVAQRYLYNYGLAEIELPGAQCYVLPTEFTRAWNEGELRFPRPRQKMEKRSA